MATPTLEELTLIAVELILKWPQSEDRELSWDAIYHKSTLEEDTSIPDIYESIPKDQESIALHLTAQ